MPETSSPPAAHGWAWVGPAGRRKVWDVAVRDVGLADLDRSAAGACDGGAGEVDQKESG
jgi:hypothetical protein